MSNDTSSYSEEEIHKFNAYVDESPQNTESTEFIPLHTSQISVNGEFCGTVRLQYNIGREERRRRVQKLRKMI